MGKLILPHENIILSYIPLEGGGVKIERDSMVNGLRSRIPKNNNGVGDVRNNAFDDKG